MIVLSHDTGDTLLVIFRILCPLPMLWGHMSIWGHLGTLGSKGHFHYKCYNLSMLHSMTIGLIHVHQFETLYLCYGVKC